MAALLAMLLLSPVVAEDTQLRLVSVGTDAEPVTWHLDGVPVAETDDGRTATVNLTPGAHELLAQSDHPGPWTVLARPDPDEPGVTYVPGWTATVVPAMPGGGADGFDAPFLPVAAALGALAGLLWPTRRTKQPRGG